MKKQSWLFRKLNLNLRMEIIINISLLMLAAILLIGFTISKMNEKKIIQEKIENGERMIQDFQVMIDFITREKKEVSLVHPVIKKEIQDFIRIYTKEGNFHDLVIADLELKVVASKRMESVEKGSSSDLMTSAIRSGQFNTNSEKSGGFLSTHYQKLILCSPLWFRGKIVGGVQMEIPMGDVMAHLLESQRMILISIILDAIVLIVFGSFLLSRVLVTPLKELIQLTQKISEGDFHLNPSHDFASKP